MPLFLVRVTQVYKATRVALVEVKLLNDTAAGDV